MNIELDPISVAITNGSEEVAVEVQRQLRVESAIERDQVTAQFLELIDLREDVLAPQDVPAILVRQHVERAVIALGDAHVRVVDDAHDQVGRDIRLVEPGSDGGREALQQIIVRFGPE
jgi:hypothetical protein